MLCVAVNNHPLQEIVFKFAIHLFAEGTIAVSMLVTTACPGFLSELRLMLAGCRDPEAVDLTLLLPPSDEDFDADDHDDAVSTHSFGSSPGPL